MFFFIGGVQPRVVLMDETARTCPSCGYPRTCRKRVDHYLSLFFIPLFPLKRGTPFFSCGKCRTVFDEGGERLDGDERREQNSCRACGRPVERDHRFCPYCGKGL